MSSRQNRPANWRSPQGREEGGFLYGLWHEHRQLEGVPSVGQVYELRFGRGAVDARMIREGDPVWRTQDPGLNVRVKPLLDSADPVHTRPVTAHFVGRVGEVPALTLTDNQDRHVTVHGEAPLQEARSRSLDEAALREQLGKLGGTPYHLSALSADLHGAGFLPVSALNTLRRDAVAALTALRGQAPERQTRPKLADSLAALGPPAPTEPGTPRLHVLVRTPEQLDAALEVGADSVTLDYLELYGLKPSVERVKAAGIPVRVASPRILKPTEQNLEKFLLSLDAELLVRSGGLLEGLQDAPNRPALTGDFSLNAANVLTTRALLDLGLTRITPTHDLNARQITELAGLVGPDRLEVIAYQHLPVFHTEHCVFCRFLSDGTDYTNCGHPCESHRVALRDERGVQHPVMADVGCRNTVFEGRPQVAGLHLEDWLGVGLRDFRLEFVHETPEQVREVIRLHRAALSSELDLTDLQEALDALADQGTTEGSLFVPNDFRLLDALPLLG